MLTGKIFKRYMKTLTKFILGALELCSQFAGTWAAAVWFVYAPDAIAF